MKVDGSVRQRILDAALDIAESQGIKALTQPRVAKAAGVRQSHLTYYFPRKADLFIALLQGSHERAAKRQARRRTPINIDEMFAMLRGLMFDPLRMRFFLGIVLEASEEPELRAILDEHARGLVGFVAPFFDRQADDPAVIAFVDRLRGIGLRLLLEPKGAAQAIDLPAVASSFKLHPTNGARGDPGGQSRARRKAS